MVNKGMVYLVGAGPGDPGLITIKGKECLEKSEVIIYDRLAGEGILRWAPDAAELIYVGKTPEKHTLKQDEINQLILSKAREGKIVTRLKGGDPFVFGRGGEEGQILFESGTPFEVVPGITSAIAVPAYAGIPVTHRGVSSSFEVITGNEDPEKKDSQIDWARIASSKGTLVFLMGMANLPKISGQLIKYGMAENMPVAVIQWGTILEQKTVTGVLKNIQQRVVEEGLANPGVIVVGEVVKLRNQLSWYEKKPFWGKTVLVTRAREQASTLSKMIEELGGQALEFPTIKIREPDNKDGLDKAIKDIGKYKWLIFTSVNGVKYFFDRLLQFVDIRELKDINICAIGPATRDKLETLGLRVEFVPSEYRAEEIVNGLKGKISKGDRILLPRADIARKILVELLSEEGAIVDEVAVYKTVIEEVSKAVEIRELIKAGRIDIVTFTSSSTVRNFVDLLGRDIIPWLDKLQVACIGPITADTAEEIGIRVDIQAGEYTIKGLIAGLLEQLEGV